MGDTATDTATDADIDAAPSPLRNVGTELVATTILMLLGPGVLILSDVGTLGAAIGFGAGLAIAIGVIGALANPALTMALLVVREVSPGEAVGDWIGQFLGAILGAAMIWGIGDQTRVAVGSNGWDRNGLSDLGAVAAAELVFVVLVVVVTLSAISRGLSTTSIAAFASLAYGAAHLVLIPISGGGLNPARSLGSAIFSDTDPNALGQVWVFVLVPLAGALAAVLVWLVIDEATVDDTVFDETIVDDAADLLDGTKD